MGDFGHTYSNGPGFCCDSWGWGPFVIEAGGKSFRFEDSDQFGPWFLKENNEPRANQNLSERSPFWRAHRIWVRQGRRVADDGITCVWDEPKPMLVKRLGKRSGLIVDCGEEDGRVVFVESAP